MKINLKKALLAGSAIVAVAAFAPAAYAGNTANLVGTASATTPPAAGETLQVTGNTTNSIWDAVDGLGDATADMVFLGSGAGASSIKFESSTGVGGVMTLRDIDITDDASASTVNINGTNGVVALRVLGDVTNNDNAAGNDVAFVLTDGSNSSTLTFEGLGSQLIEATISAGVAGDGTLKFNSSGAGGVGRTFTGAVGGTALGLIDISDTSTATFLSTVNADSITFNSAGKLNFAGDVTSSGGIDFNNKAGTVNFSSGGADFTGNIFSTGGANGTLTFASNHTLTGNIGLAAVTRLAAVTTTNGASSTVTITGNTNATNFNVNGAGTVTLGGQMTLTGGSMTFGAAGTVNFNSTTGTYTATSINFNNFDGTLNIVDGADVAANIVDTSDGKGTVNFAGSSDVTGDVGASGGSALEEVNFNGGTGKTVTISDELAATAININGVGTVDVGGDITGATSFEANGTLLVSGDGVTVTGAIDNGTGSNGAGTVEFDDVGGGSSVTGNIGATNTLLAVNLTGAGGAVTFGGTVAATTIGIQDTATGTFNQNVTGAVNFTSAGTVVLAATKTITGAVNNTSGTDNTGTLTLAGTNSVSGAIGSSNSLNRVNINGAAATSFGSTVDANEIEVGGAAAVSFAGDVTSATGIDLNNNNATLTFATGSDMTGSIFSTGGANGTVTFSSNSTVTGSIGTGAGTGISTINAGANAGTVTVSGNVFGGALNVTGSGTFTPAGNVTLTGAFTFNGDGTVAFASGKNLTATGAVNGSGGDGVGNLEFEGHSTVAANLGTGANTLNTLTLSGDDALVAQTGNLVIADVTDLGNNTMTVTGTVGAGAGQELVFAISSANASGVIDTFGNIQAGGAATINAGALITVDVASTDYIADGQSITVVDGTGGAGVATITAANITDNSLLLSFAQDVADTANLVLDITRVASTTVATGGNNTGAGTLLEAIAGSGDAALDVVQGNLASAATAEAVNDVLESVQPTADGGAVVAAVDAVNTTMNITGERLAMVRTGDDSAGIATGDVATGVSTWGQVFGNHSNQDRRDGIDGYDSDTWGLTFGIDSRNILDKGVVGLAFSYGDTNVDSENANTTATDVSSYQIALYGNYDLDNKAFFNGLAAYTFNDTETTRHNVGGVGGPNADGDFNANQFTVRGELGRDYAFEQATLTPSLRATWMHYDAEDYNETGSGANLHVDSDSVNLFEVGFNLNASWMYRNADGSFFQPMIHGGIRHDFVGDQIESTASFLGAPAAGSFQTNGPDPAQTTFDAGVGFKYYNTANWEFSADYDYSAKADFDAHSGYLRAAYKF